jgi:hypothetical protein
MEESGGDVWTEDPRMQYRCGRDDAVQEPHVLFDLLELCPD